MLLSIVNPKGMMPKISPDLIGFERAQVAENCDLSDGQLRPWDNYLLTQPCDHKGIIQTIYLYQDTHWFEWEAEVDIVPAPVSGDTQGKFYYTGDGIPKKSNEDEATTGSGSMPINFYPLAVSAPKNALSSSINSATGSGDDRDVIYIWTVVTDWSEEFYPFCEASTALTCKNGDTIDLSGMSLIWEAGTSYALNEVVFPTASEGGTYMYVCVQAGTTAATEPTWGTTVDGDTIDGTVKWRCFENNLETKRIYRLAVGTEYATFNFVDSIGIDETTYQDTKEDDDLGDPCPSLNINDGGSADEDWDAPPQNLTNLTYHGYGIMLGSVGKDLYISIQYRPWAWPIAYINSVLHDIVAIAQVGDGISVVFTEEGNYLVTGTTPSSITVVPLSVVKPIQAKRSAVNCEILSEDGYIPGVLYAAPDGLRHINSSGANTLITEKCFDVKEWAEYHPEVMQGCIHNNKYFGFYQTSDTEGGIVFDLNTGNFTTLDFYSFATFVDPKTDTLYFLRSTKMSLFNETWIDPDARSTSGKATQYELTAAGNVAGISQPDYPRNLVLTITDANASLTALQVTITGTLADGENEATETFTTTTAGSHDLNEAWAHIDSITVDSVAGGEASDYLDVGWGKKFGLGNSIESEDDVIKANIDNDDSAVSGQTISTVYNTIQFATDPDAAHDYQVYYLAEE